METMVTMTIQAVLPWNSLDGQQRAEVYTYDSQSQIDYCLHQCPYADCVNCAAGGRAARAGRPPLLREAELNRLRELLEKKTKNEEICAMMHMDADFLRRCKRKIRRESKCVT